MQNLDESTFTGGRFFDFRKRPFDGLNKRTVYQFWPAFESEMKRKGLSPVMDLRFNPLPTEPTASFRKVAHDDAAMQVLVTAYDAALSGHLLNGGVAPDIDSLNIAPDDLAATSTDRKAIKSYHDEMERQATSANQALGIFISFTTKSVPNDLAHILDESIIHPRHKLFQLRDFFTRQTAPNVAIGEKIKMEIGDLPQARNYTEILGVANSIRDLQAELTLVNPMATLTLSEMVSKLLSKIQDKEFQMLRYQIAEWEELRLAALVVPQPPPPPPPSLSRFSSATSSMSSSSSSSPFSAGGGGAGGGSALRVSNTSLGVLVQPVAPRPLSVSVQFRPVIDLIQKFHLSMSTLDSSTHGLNSVDVIINGGGAGASQQSLAGNQSPMWGMPRPDFLSPDFRLPAYLQWMSQFDTTLKSPGNGGYMKQVQRKDDNYQRRQTGRNFQPSNSRNERRSDNSHRGAKSSRGDSSSRRRRDDVSNRDESASRGESSHRGERNDSRSTSSRNDSRDHRSRDRENSERFDRKRDRSAQASSLTVDLDEDDQEDDDHSVSSDGSHSN